MVIFMLGCVMWLSVITFAGGWALRRRTFRRKVRLQLQGSVRITREGYDETSEISIEGIYMGRTRGHYILAAPKIVSGPDETVDLAGTVEVPKYRVIFIQVLT